MNRFFTKSQTQSISRPEGRTLSCFSCGLYKHCITPKMEPYGNFKKGILNIGEAPGEFEDKKGRPWQGKTGKLLQETYKKLGIDLFDDCLNINAVSCRPIDPQWGNRTPTNHEIQNCRRFVLSAIDKYKPKIIVLFGNVAVQSVIGHRWKKDLGGITKWRGFRIPDQDFKCWICPTLHPSFVEREGQVEQAIWEQDLKSIISLVGTPIREYKEPDISIIEDLRILEALKHEVAIDYETPAIKPHTNGYRIVSASVAPTTDYVYSFLMPEIRSKQRPFLNLIADDTIGKIAHNMKFEQSWSVNCLYQPVVNWVWDTMLAAHVLDNRDKITSLKFQTYTSFGVIDYDSEIAPYLSGEDSKDANSPNKIYELLKQPGGREMLLRYNGLDSIHTKRLADMQRADILLPF